jgi:hypothetical protein
MKHPTIVHTFHVAKTLANGHIRTESWCENALGKKVAPNTSVHLKEHWAVIFLHPRRHAKIPVTITLDGVEV